MTTANDNDDDTALQLKLEGNKLFKAAKYKEALKKYKKACELRPSVPAYWSNAAACYEKLEDFDGMKEAASRCIEADDSFIKGYYRLAVAQKELEELSEAKQAIEQALRLDDGKDAALQFLKIQLDDMVDLFKCHKCGIPDKTSSCSRCHVVSYCSRECQVADWPEHKKGCQSLGSTIPTVINCQNCMKELKARRVCSKCEAVHYCSRRCQVNHWSQHKPACRNHRRSQNVAAELGQTSVQKLFSTWRTRSKFHVGFLATNVMTKKQFMEQPPSFIVSIVVAFNYNFMTYLPREDPQVVPIVALPDDVRMNAETQVELVSSKAKSSVERSFGHVFLITESTDSEMKTGAFMPQLLTSASYQKYSREEIESLIRADVNLNPGVLQSWHSDLQNNLKAQLNAFKMAGGTNWSSFLVYALRVYSSHPRYKTHGLVVDYEVGFGLGKIAKITEYKVFTLEKVRDLFRNNPKFPPVMVQQVLEHSLDVENSPKLLQSRVARPGNVLLVVIFRAHKSDNLLFADSQLYELESNMPIVPPKKCDKKANEFFRRLQTISLPDVSSPSLNNIKPVPV